MVKIAPFKALRPPVELAARVAAPPYDVLNSNEARVLSGGDEMSFLRVNKPEIDLSPTISQYDVSVYEKGKENLSLFEEKGFLKRDTNPGIYIYAQRMGDHLQYGICAGCSVEEYASGIIKRHEKTTVKKENDRTRLTYTQNANVGPVFLTYRATKVIDDIVEKITSQPAETEITTDDNISHYVWPVLDAGEVAKIQAAFNAVPAMYIADGHHRSASAYRVGEMKIKEAIAEGLTVTGEEPFNYFLAVCFPSNQLKVLEYNRCVQDLNNHTPEAFLKLCHEKFDIRELSAEESVSDEARHPPVKSQYTMCLQGKWYLLTAKVGSFDPTDPVNSLDVQVLYNNLLAPLLGIGDPRLDERIKYVGGLRGVKELETLVTGPKPWGQVSFCLYPVQLDEVMTIADCDLLMPPKATWFEPKLRSGLIVKTYDEEA